MPTRPSPTARRAVAAAVVAVVVGVVGPLVALPVAAQTDPAPSTEPVPEGGADETSTTLPTVAGDEGGADDAAVDDARTRADADLRSVWVVVAALGAVALGLLVLLVLYVRATNPARSARRRELLATRAEDRRRARAERTGTVADDPVSPADDEVTTDASTAPADRPLVAAAAPAAVAPAASGAAVLSRDPSDGEAEAVRVLGTPTGGPTLAKGPAQPESRSAPVTQGTGAGTRRRTKAPAVPPTGRLVAPAGPPPGPTDGDETVRIVPAPTPTVVPAPPGGGAIIAAPPGGSSGDRPPPRALVDSPPPPRRPRRVDAPAKKLGTPDAERVLVRPGQTPVRVPPSLERPDAPADDQPPDDVPADESETTDDDG